METRIRQDIPPDKAMRKRAKKVGVVGVSALSAMGALAGGQAVSAERRVEPVANAISSEDVHGVRSVISTEVEKSSHNEVPKPDLSTDARDDEKGKEKAATPEVESQYLEPAQWWPTGVKENWLLIQSSAKEYNIDPYLVATIMGEESRGQNINNPSGATGLMQIMPATAQGIANMRGRAYYDMSDPAQNLDFALYLIKYLDDKYIGGRGVDIDTELGIAMAAVYIGDGEGAGELWSKNGYSSQFLSAQAQHVIPIWTSMYRDRHNSTSQLYGEQMK